MITASALSKQFGSIKAVDGVSFEIPRGQTFGLLGPNGAGKSTTINMIVGLLKPDSGTVTINGQDDPTRAEVRLQLGNAPQSLSLYEELTAEENLQFYGRLFRLAGSKLTERTDWALEFAMLVERKKDRVATFSGGMKRRLNMAVALIHDPQVVLFDEPTVGVDPQSRNAIFDAIEVLKRDGRTIVYTTHYMEEAERLCDKVAIIDHGKILALDTVGRLIDAHGGKSVVTIELMEKPSDTSSLPGELDDHSLRIETERPLEQVAELVGTGLKIRQLHVERADLEQVFLNLTGRRLRD